MSFAIRRHTPRRAYIVLLMLPPFCLRLIYFSSPRRHATSPATPVFSTRFSSFYCRLPHATRHFFDCRHASADFIARFSLLFSHVLPPALLKILPRCRLRRHDDVMPPSFRRFAAMPRFYYHETARFDVAISLRYDACSCLRRYAASALSCLQICFRRRFDVSSLDVGVAVYDALIMATLQNTDYDQLPLFFAASLRLCMMLFDVIAAAAIRHVCH